LWREFSRADNDERPRVEVDANVKALDADIVYVLGTDGNLWREKGTMQVRTRVAANVHAFQAVDDNTVYVLCPGDILFRIQLRHEMPVADQPVRPIRLLPVPRHELRRRHIWLGFEP
jgi:hypothetical protein